MNSSGVTSRYSSCRMSSNCAYSYDDTLSLFINLDNKPCAFWQRDILSIARPYLISSKNIGYFAIVWNM